MNKSQRCRHCEKIIIGRSKSAFYCNDECKKAYFEKHPVSFYEKALKSSDSISEALEPHPPAHK